MAHCVARLRWKRALKTVNGASRSLLNAVENKQDYLEKLQATVSQLHNCGATWCGTVPVHEVFRGKTVWQGDVEVFDLHNHPKAKRAYAWSHSDGKNEERTHLVAVLEIPPVDSAKKAVQVQIVKDAKDNLKKQMDKATAEIEKRKGRRF
jgi:hypothetical protein